MVAYLGVELAGDALAMVVAYLGVLELACPCYGGCLPWRT